MNAAFLTAGVVLQALLLLGLAASIWLLARQLRYLHSRLPPAGALVISGGPQPGTPAPQFTLESQAGTAITVGQSAQMLFFFSSTCTISRTLMPVLRNLAQSEGLAVVYASDGAAGPIEALAASAHVPKSQLVLSEDLGRAYGVARVPQAVLVGDNGSILSRGLVNTREHIESLLNARDHGLPTLQAHMARTPEASTAPN